ncbi:MAG: hypothetical protein ACWA47_12760 [Brevirhabdus sp.]
MNRRQILLLGLTGTLAACGTVRESRLNPFNWFGRDREKRVKADEAVLSADPRPLVDEVISVRVDRNNGGAILHAIGLPPEQGYFDGELVPLNDGLPVKGTLSFEFRAFPPPKPTRVSTQRSREILVGLFLSNQQMSGARKIEVIAARNRRSVSRR